MEMLKWWAFHYEVHHFCADYSASLLELNPLYDFDQTARGLPQKRRGESSRKVKDCLWSGLSRSWNVGLRRINLGLCPANPASWDRAHGRKCRVFFLQHFITFRQSRHSRRQLLQIPLQLDGSHAGIYVALMACEWFATPNGK